MAIPTVPVTWTVPKVGSATTVRVNVNAAVPGDDHSQVVNPDGNRTLSSYLAETNMAPGQVITIDLPAVDAPGWNVAGTPVANWEYEFIATSGVQATKDNVAPVVGQAPIVIRQDTGVAGQIAAVVAGKDAEAASEDAAAAQQTATNANILATSADKRSTTATVNPVAADASGRPEGATWEVVQVDGTVIRRWILRDGAWVPTVLQGTNTIKSGSTDPGRMSVGLGGNLIPDPNFWDPNIWNIAPPRSLLSGAAMGGWRSLQVPLSGSGEPEFIDFSANLMPGDSFKLSFIVRSTVGITSYRVLAYWYGLTSSSPDVLAGGNTSTANWTERDQLGAFTVPSDATSIFFRVEITNTTTFRNRVFQFNHPRMERTLDTRLLSGPPILGGMVADGNTLNSGVWRGATDIEVAQRTRTDRVMTPSNLEALQAGTNQRGLIQLATSAQTTAETDGFNAVTPVGLKIWNASKDTGWVRLTLASGWTAAANWPSPAYRVKNGVVFLRGRLNATAAAGTTMFTLPANANAPELANDGTTARNGDVYVFAADAGAYARVALYTRANDPAFIGALFLAGKSGAVSNLSLSAITYPND